MTIKEPDSDSGAPMLPRPQPGDHASGRRAYGWAAALLLLVALAVRLPSLAERSLWLDEAYSAFFIRETFSALWNSVPLYETHPPLFYALLKLWSMVFGDSEAGLRSLSVVAGIATLVVIACYGRVAVFAQPARLTLLIALTFLATNQDMVRRAQEARPYALQMLAATIAILAAISLLRRFGSDGWNWRALVPQAAALALGGGVALWLHNTSFFICLGIWAGFLTAVWMQGQGRRTEKLLIGMASGAAALLVWLPYLPMYLTQTKMMGSIPFWRAADIGDLWGAWLMIGGSFATFGALALLVVVGLLSIARVDRPQAVFLGIVLFLPLGSVLVINFTLKPIFIDRLFAWMTPLLALTAAHGLVALWAGRRSLAIGLAAILLAGNVLTTMRWLAYTPEPWRDMIDAIALRQRPGDVVVAAPNELTAPIHYYATRQDHFPRVVYAPGPFPLVDPARRYITNLGAPAIEPEDGMDLAKKITGAKRIWVLSRNLPLFDKDKVVHGVLKHNRREVFAEESGGVLLQLYE